MIGIDECDSPVIDGLEWVTHPPGGYLYFLQVHMWKYTAVPGWVKSIDDSNNQAERREGTCM